MYKISNSDQHLKEER